MTRETFEEIVRDTVASLPEKFHASLSNLDIVVEDYPSLELLNRNGLDPNARLYGLYEGVTLTDRFNYGEVLPDKITIFRKTLEQDFPDYEALINEIRVTVLHEIAHHFGTPESRMDELGL